MSYFFKQNISFTFNQNCRSLSTTKSSICWPILFASCSFTWSGWEGVGFPGLRWSRAWSSPPWWQLWHCFSTARWITCLESTTARPLIMNGAITRTGLFLASQFTLFIPFWSSVPFRWWSQLPRSTRRESPAYRVACGSTGRKTSSKWLSLSSWSSMYL